MTRSEIILNILINRLSLWIIKFLIFLGISGKFACLWVPYIWWDYWLVGAKHTVDYGWYLLPLAFQKLVWEHEFIFSYAELWKPVKIRSEEASQVNYIVLSQVDAFNGRKITFCEKFQICKIVSTYYQRKIYVVKGLLVAVFGWESLLQNCLIYCWKSFSKTSYIKVGQ